MRKLLIASIFVGSFLGAVIGLLIQNTTAGASIHYIVFQAPPSGTSGQSPVLTQGWHGTYSIALDWDNTNNYDVWFRGWAYRGGSPLENNRLVGRPYTVSSGSSVCDVVDVQVREHPDAQYLRYDLTYTHALLYSASDFPIITSGSYAYNNYQLAYMVWDYGCPFTGWHVHESHLPPGYPVYASWNTGLYPTGPCPNDYCGTYQNNNINNSTRAFDWWSN